MPQYDYKCKNCLKNFSIVCGINDSRENVACPTCDTSHVVRIYNASVLKGSRAKGFQTEATKPAADKVTEKETISPKPEEHSHEHCSPELDYQ